MTKKAFTNIGYYIWKHVCVRSCIEHPEGDVELGEREGSKAIDGTLLETPVEKAKNEFRVSLQKIFSEAIWVDEIMWGIKIWEDGT